MVHDVSRSRTRVVRVWRTAMLAPLVLAFALTHGVVSAAPIAQIDDDCDSALASRFAPEFGSLAAVLADFIGTPIDCPEIDEDGDLVQATSTGMAIWLVAAEKLVFTNGTEAWLLGSEGLFYYATLESEGVPVAGPAVAVAPPSVPEVLPASAPTPVPAPAPSIPSPAAPAAGGLVGSWNYTSAQYQDGARGLRTVGIGGDLHLRADGSFRMYIHFGSAAGQRTGEGTYAITGDVIVLSPNRGQVEQFRYVLGSRPGTNGGVLDTMTLTPSGSGEYTYTLSKPR